MLLYDVVPATRGNRWGQPDRPWNVVRRGDGRKVGRGATKEDALLKAEQFDAHALSFLLAHGVDPEDSKGIKKQRNLLREALEAMYESFGKCKCGKSQAALVKTKEALASSSWMVCRREAT